MNLNRVLPIAFALSCVLLQGCTIPLKPYESGYEIIEGKVYWTEWSYSSNRHKRRELVGVDTDSFTEIEGRRFNFGRYAKDKSAVYHNGKLIPQADPKTFTFIAKSYTKDAQHLYYAGKVIESASPHDFQIPDYFENYAISDTRLIYENKIYELCDADSFKIFNKKDEWSTDKNCVYYEGQKVPDIDPTTLKILNRYFATDQNFVYAGTQRLEHTNPSSFELVKLSRSSDIAARDGERCWNKQGVSINCTPTKEVDVLNMPIASLTPEQRTLARKLIAEMYEAEENLKLSILENENQTRANIIKRNKHKYLGPDNLSEMGLASLPIGYTFSLKSSLNELKGPSEKITYTLTRKLEGKVYFDVSHNRNSDVLTEIRLENGLIVREARHGKFSPSEIEFKDHNCQYVIGECKEQGYRVDTENPFAIKPQTIRTTFENNVWEYARLNRGGVFEIKKRIAYDQYGLPLHIIEMDGQELKNEFIRIQSD